VGILWEISWGQFDGNFLEDFPENGSYLKKIDFQLNSLKTKHF
jgi:hypothetical protein